VIFQASPTTIAAALARAAANGTVPVVGAAATGAGPHRPAPASTAIPVFIVGGSGKERELLREGLGNHPNLSTAPEDGRFADLAGELERSWDALAVHGYPEQYWRKQLAEGFAEALAQRAAAEGKGRWVELLDAGELPLDTLDRFFPTAVIINLVADGFLGRNPRSARRAAARLSAGRYYEVHTRHLQADRVAVRTGILTFLGEETGR
jgi:hypothetical protein